MSVKIQLMKAKSGDGAGPLKVEGDFQLLDMEGQEIPHPEGSAHLCRCGASSRKPFCDGTHAKVGFKG